MTVTGGNTRSIEDIIEQVVPQTRHPRICLRGDLAELLDDARSAWAAAVAHDRETGEDTARAARTAVVALEQEAADAEVEFEIQALDPAVWRALVAEHPPPDDGQGWRWHPDTFPPAAVAASCVAPKMTAEQAATLASRLSDGQWQKLFGATMVVNVGDDLLPKYVLGTEGPATSAPSSTTAAP